jgi:hypothetical protein
MLHCHIALIHYIAFVLLHYFDVQHCHVALICYIAFNMLRCFDMLHCFWYAAFLWYATLPHYFDMLHCFCSAALLWCATFPHCFDMVHCLSHVALLRYASLILMCCIALIYYIAQWWKRAKWDECGNMGQHYCTIKISASNNMLQMGHSIKLKSKSI